MVCIFSMYFLSIKIHFVGLKIPLKTLKNSLAVQRYKITHSCAPTHFVLGIDNIIYEHYTSVPTYELTLK
jgi:hypothetical protein